MEDSGSSEVPKSVIKQEGQSSSGEEEKKEGLGKSSEPHETKNTVRSVEEPRAEAATLNPGEEPVAPEREREEIALVENETVDALFARLPEVPPEWEYLRQVAADILIESPSISEQVLQGKISEIDIARRLEQLATQENFRNVCTVNPITDERTTNYHFVRERNQLKVHDSRDENELVEYDLVMEITDPESGRVIPTVVEVKSGGYSTAGGSKEDKTGIMRSASWSERLRPLQEKYGTNTFCFVVVLDPEAKRNDSPIQHAFTESMHGKIATLPPNEVDEVKLHVSEVMTAFEKTDYIDTSAPETVVVQTPEMQVRITEVAHELEGQITRDEMTALPSLSELATQYSIPRSSARLIYETLKDNDVIHVSDHGIVIGSATESEQPVLRRRRPGSKSEREARKEELIRRFLDADLHEGELLPTQQWMKRLGIPKVVVGSVFQQLTEEGYITRFSSKAKYFGTDRSLFHRRYTADPVEQVKQYLGTRLSDRRSRTIARELGISLSIVEQVKDGLV